MGENPCPDSFYFFSSSDNAASTCSLCVFGSTPVQTFAIFPSGSIKTCCGLPSSCPSCFSSSRIVRQPSYRYQREA